MSEVHLWMPLQVSQCIHSDAGGRARLLRPSQEGLQLWLRPLQILPEIHEQQQEKVNEENQAI